MIFVDQKNDLQKESQDKIRQFINLLMSTLTHLNYIVTSEINNENGLFHRIFWHYTIWIFVVNSTLTPKVPKSP